MVALRAGGGDKVDCPGADVGAQHALDLVLAGPGRVDVTIELRVES